MTRTRPLFAAVVFAALVVVAGCDVEDPTTVPPPTPAHEQPTTSGYVPKTAGEPGDDCPVATVQCPLPWVTPGAVIPSTAGVCSTSYNPRRELTVAQKRHVLAAYGIPLGTRIKEYDHLEPRWAGGRSDPSNVWPEVDPAEVARKDALEDHDYRAVCVSKTMTLAEARRRAARFWAYWPAKFSAVRDGGRD
jgi:hypothetical protein